MEQINKDKMFETVSETIAWLKDQGYTIDFNIHEGMDSLYTSPDEKLHPDQFQIDRIYRFEGITDPGDEDVIYAISSVDQKQKGILMNAFGAYSDSFSAELIKKLSLK